MNALSLPAGVVCEGLQNSPRNLWSVVSTQTELVPHAALEIQEPPVGDRSATVESNEEAWRLFHMEHLYDTRQVTLNGFHLFEWFPLAPGRYHTPEGKGARAKAAPLEMKIDGEPAYTPPGKALMVEGGVGAVRLRPRKLGRTEYYFMTASSTSVCHEGFPVAVPRKFYGRLKPRMLQEGAAPVRLSGEMRYVSERVAPLLGWGRAFPLLMLHATEVELLSAPRAGVGPFEVSVVLSFVGTSDGQPGEYITYDSFNAADPVGASRAADWLANVYIKRVHAGYVITDFDEVHPKFPDAAFGLSRLLSGQWDVQQVKEALRQANLQAGAEDEKKFVVNINNVRQYVNNAQRGAKVTGIEFRDEGQ